MSKKPVSYTHLDVYKRQGFYMTPRVLVDSNGIMLTIGTFRYRGFCWEMATLALRIFSISSGVGS